MFLPFHRLHLPFVPSDKFVPKGNHACSPIKELCIWEAAVSFLVQNAAPLAAALKQNSLYIEFVHQRFAQVLYYVLPHTELLQIKIR